MDNPAQAPGDDAGLVAGLRAGETAAFETLMRDHGPRLFAVARRILGDADEAREAVHEAFISAFRARAQFNGDARISTWLHRIVVNASLSKLRTRQRRSEEALDDLLPRFLPDGRHAQRFTSWSEPVDVAIGRQETTTVVREAIDRLPESFRMVLLLRDIEELSTDETATILKTSANAVKLRLHRARMALRTLLSSHFEGART